MQIRVRQLAMCLALGVVAWPQFAWAIVPSKNASRAIEPLRDADSASRPSADQRRPTTTWAIELPQGDPFTLPLDFSTAERRLFADAEDGQLDEHSLIEAALIAAATGDRDQLARYRARFSDLCEELHRRADNQATAPAKIEIIHRLLHEQVLQRYDADATRLATAFDTGVYNCASGTVLLIALAAEAGLNAQAIELPGHVRAIVADGNAAWEVEITSPSWSEAIRRLDDGAAEMERQSYEVAKRSRPAPDNAGSPLTPSPARPFTRSFLPSAAVGEGGTATQAEQRRPVSNLGLIATIYYNQGIDAFHQQRFSAAIAANRRALLLDGANAEARGNLLAAVNNWALALCEAEKLDEAEALLVAGKEFDPSHRPFIHNADFIDRVRRNAHAR